MPSPEGWGGFFTQCLKHKTAAFTIHSPDRHSPPPSVCSARCCAQETDERNSVHAPELQPSLIASKGTEQEQNYASYVVNSCDWFLM